MFWMENISPAHLVLVSSPYCNQIDGSSLNNSLLAGLLQQASFSAVNSTYSRTSAH